MALTGRVIIPVAHNNLETAELSFTTHVSLNKDHNNVDQWPLKTVTFSPQSFKLLGTHRLGKYLEYVAGRGGGSGGVCWEKTVHKTRLRQNFLLAFQEVEFKIL